MNAVTLATEGLLIARQATHEIVLTIGNTGQTIAGAAQEYIFERFNHASSSATDGHGLGLNLACELSRLHGGDLRLLRSENDWTEFEVRFRVAQTTPVEST